MTSTTDSGAELVTELRLSDVELDACWETLQLGDTPFTLSLPSPGYTYAERDQLLAETLARLQHRGLADEHGPVDALAAQLRLLCAPQYQIDLRLGGHPYGDIVGIGAVSGERASVVLRRGEVIRLIPATPPRVIGTLLGIAGLIRPGTGSTVNLPAEVYDDAGLATTDGSLWTMADKLIERGVSRSEATSWVRMCTGVRSFGQLGTAVWRDGVPRFGSWVIGFHRAESGHFLQLRRPGPYGATVTVSPVDAARLHRLTEELLAEHHPK